MAQQEDLVGQSIFHESLATRVQSLSSELPHIHMHQDIHTPPNTIRFINR